MRYGHQPLSEIERMTLEDILLWSEEIAALIKLENTTTNSPED